MLQGIDLTSLSLDTLEGIADAVDSFVFSQQQTGEKFHPSYRTNRKLFKKLIRQTVAFRRDMSRYFADQYSRIHTLANTYLVRASEETDPVGASINAYLSDVNWDEEEKTLSVILEVNLGDILATGAKATEMQLQTDLNIGPQTTEEAKFLRDYSVKVSGEITQTTKKRITQQIKTSIEVGETRQQLTGRIDKVLNNPARARMIAQTESIRAYAEGRLAVGRRLQIPYKQLQAFQVDQNEICGMVSGDVVPIDDSFKNGLSSPPFHPNCLIGATLVAAEFVSKAYKRWFEGEVITVTIAGQNITATPNHPILTERGWVAAGALKVGDRLYKRLDWNDLMVNPDDDYMVSRIEDMFSSFKMAIGMSTISMPLSSEHFHGDATVDTEVEIIDTNGFLPDNNTKWSQLFIHQPFGYRHFLRKLFIVQCSIDSLAQRLFASAHGVVSGLRASFTSLWGSPLCLNLHNLAGSALIQPSSFKLPADSIAVSASDTPSEINKRFAGKIALMEIEDINISKFSGHVYNLETEDGYYFANSIITHNCRCSIKLLYENPNGETGQLDIPDLSEDSSLFDSAR